MMLYVCNLFNMDLEIEYIINNLEDGIKCIFKYGVI